MNKLYRTLLAASLAAGLGLGAIAQTAQAPASPAGPDAPRMMRGEHGRMDPARMERMRARMDERQARRLGELKQRLQITPQQEAAWSGWTAALKPVRLQRPDRAEMQRLTTPERIDRVRALRTERTAAMDRKLDATKTFYAALSAEQKRLFDAESMRFLRAGMRDGKGGHRMGGRHHG